MRTSETIILPQTNQQNQNLILSSLQSSCYYSSSTAMMSMSIGQEFQSQVQIQQPQQSYQEILAAGIPVQPLDFPIPNIHRSCTFTRQSILNQNHHQSAHHPIATVLGNRKQQQQLHYDDETVVCRIADRSVTTLSSTTSISSATGVSSDYGYWMKELISPSTYGTVQFGIVVRKRNNTSCSSECKGPPTLPDQNSNQNIMTDWITTDEVVAIKVSSLATTKERNNHTTQNGKFSTDSPSTEAACLQLIGNYHENVLGCIEVLQDDDTMYIVMPYCVGGTLESYIHTMHTVSNTPNNPRVRSSNCHRHYETNIDPTTTSSLMSSSQHAVPLPIPLSMNHSNQDMLPSDHTVRTVSSDGTYTTNDDTASTTMFTVYEDEMESITATKIQFRQHEERVRGLFLQLLNALQHLQKKGVCHRNINSSNVLIESVHNNNTIMNIVLINFAHAARIPYKDDSNIGGIADVSQGMYRLLIKNDYLLLSKGNKGHIGHRNSNYTNNSSSNHRHSHVRRYHSMSPSTRRTTKNSNNLPKKTTVVAMPSSSTTTSIGASSGKSYVTFTNNILSHNSQSSSQFTCYTAPEILEGQPYDGYTIDLWSVGVLLYVLLMNGTLPFHIPNIQLDIQYRYINSGQLRQHILRTVGTNQPQQYISDHVIDLLQNMLWYDPNKRLSLEQIMMHPWITSSTTTTTNDC